MARQQIGVHNALQAALVAVGLMGAVGAGAATVADDLRAAQLRYNVATQELAKLAERMEKARASARAADQALNQVNPDLTTEVEKLSMAADLAHQELAGLKRDKASAEQELEAAGSAQRLAARGVHCDPSKGRCEHSILTAQQYNDITLFFQESKGAQEAANKVKAASVEAYALADKANALLQDELATRPLAPTAFSGSASVAGGNPSKLERVRSMVELGKKARDKVAGVQSLVNRLNDAELALADCREAAPCRALESGQLAQGRDAAADLRRRVQESAAAVQEVKTNSYWLDPRVIDHAGSDPAKQAQAVAFLALLDKHPNAKSLFGAESARVTASASGATASLRLDLNKLPSRLTSDSALIVSVGKEDGRSTRLLSSNGAQNKASATLTKNVLRRSYNVGPDSDLFTVLGVNLNWGYSEHVYRLDGDISKDLKVHFRPLTGGVHFGVAGTRTDTFHLFRLGYVKDYENRPVGIKCQVGTQSPLGAGALLSGSVACEQAHFGAPKRNEGARGSYEYRWSYKNLGISPSFSYDDGNKQKAFSLPIYFVRDNDAEKKPLTAGIAYEWKSSTKTDPKSSHEVNVFVNAPFELFTR